MNISPQEYRTIYAVFVALFAINVTLTAWNAYQDHKLRKELKLKQNA
jgi:hypothetical protein